jgi:hypothetical protein
MKKSLLVAPVVFVVGCVIALVARLVVHASVNVPNVPASFGILFASSLLFLAFNDYSRKPRFRARSMRNAAAPATTPATSPEIDTASAWTYTTVSA